MQRMIIKVPGFPVREVELGPGVHKIGRSINTDLRLDHPSVSGSHCEIIIENGAVTVKDLGSTNGTSLDGQPVRECHMAPGQTLRLGDAELLFGAVPGVKLAATPAAEAPTAAPVPLAPHLAHLIPPRRPRRPKSFYKSIPGAFVYPLKRDGLAMLGCMTILFGVYGLFFSYHIFGLAMLAFFLGGILLALVAGYVFVFLQKIVTNTALGEDGVPSWPDYDGPFESGVLPFARLLAIWAACVAPAFLYVVYVPHPGYVFPIVLLALGACYVPMALLAVAMDDSLAGLNPLLVVPSIMRVPLEYLVVCVMFAAPLAAWFLKNRWDHYLNVPWLTPFLDSFVTLYLWMALMRVLGLLYDTKKVRLGWRV